MKEYNKFYLGETFTKKEKYKYKAPIKSVREIKEINENFCCPLCKKKKYIVVGDWSIDRLISMWVNKYGFNPIADVYRGKTLEKRYCEHCGLYFYNYQMVDTSEMYSKLSKSTDYYPNFREEFGIATEIIEKQKPKSLLEIGCGYGNFLNRINHLVSKVIGSEYNPHAVEVCKKKGLNVVSQDLSTLKSDQFDVVCHFQTLEHITDTNDVMKNSVRMLKKGGKLIIGVPDPEGLGAVFAKFQLNLPPHHQYDFSKKSLEFLGKKHKLKVSEYINVPLVYRHYVKYVEVLTGKKPSQPDLTGFYETQKRFNGQSHVIVFEKV